jgi:Putative zincin peptidase
MTIIDRFHPERRKAWQAAADEGRLREIDKLELFDLEQILPMARFSVLLFVLSGLFFVALNLFVYIWRTGQHSGSLTWGQFFLWLGINIVAYIVILPVHEVLHGIAFALWGGKPYFGTKLPLALYCSARDQIFPRNYYLVIGLAPLIVITLAGIIFILLAPALSAYVLFATIGNVAGAAGDLWVVRRLRALPASAFIEDLETGYRAWELADQVVDVPIGQDI